MDDTSLGNFCCDNYDFSKKIVVEFFFGTFQNFFQESDDIRRAE